MEPAYKKESIVVCDCKIAREAFHEADNIKERTHLVHFIAAPEISC